MSNYQEWYEAIQAIELKPSKIDQPSPIRNYTITITFDTNRELTAKELGELELTLITQVMEPADLDGEDADYETWHQTIETEEAQGFWIQKEGK